MIYIWIVKSKKKAMKWSYHKIFQRNKNYLIKKMVLIVASLASFAALCFSQCNEYQCFFLSLRCVLFFFLTQLLLFNVYRHFRNHTKQNRAMLRKPRQKKNHIHSLELVIMNIFWIGFNLIKWKEPKLSESSKQNNENDCLFFLVDEH